MDPVHNESADVGASDAQLHAQLPKLVGQRVVKHLGVIRVHTHHKTAIEILFGGMVRDRIDHTGADVGDRIGSRRIPDGFDPCAAGRCNT